jgi:hypothetical protein
MVAAIQDEGAGFDVAEHGVDSATAEATRGEMADLAQSRRRKDRRLRLGVEHCEDRRVPRRGGVDPFEDGRGVDGQPCQRR